MFIKAAGDSLLSTRKAAQWAVLAFILVGAGLGAWLLPGYADLSGRASNEATLANTVKSLTEDLQQMKNASKALEASLTLGTNDLKLLGRRLARIEDKQTALDLKLHSESPFDDREAFSEEVSSAPDVTAEHLERSVEVEVAFLDQVVRSELTDPEWAAGAEQALHDALSNLNAVGLHPIGTTCRAKLCRIELLAEGEALPHEGMRDLLDSLPWNAATFFHMTNDSDALLFVAREGYELPQ